MNEQTPNPDLDALVGAWTTEATHPSVPDTVVKGSASFEWLEGERFLILRARNDHPDFPDSISILGEFEGRLEMHYYDSRGVFRVYEMRFADGTWTMERDAPGFAQRFEGTLTEDGSELAGLWHLSEDGSTWAEDLAITYRRVG